MAGGLEKFQVQDDSERTFIKSEAEAVAAEIIERAKAKDGAPRSRPEVIVWGRFSKAEQGLEDPHPGTEFLAGEIRKAVEQMAESNPELKEALKFVGPGYALDERRTTPPDFNPTGLKQKE